MSHEKFVVVNMSDCVPQCHDRKNVHITVVSTQQKKSKDNADIRAGL